MASREPPSSQDQRRHRALTSSSSRSWDPSLQSTGEIYPSPLVDSSLNPAFPPQTRGQLAANQRLPGYDLTGSESYLNAQMAHNTQHYNWQGQSSVPLRSPMGMDQSLPQPQALSPAGFSVGYNQQASSQGYFPPPGPSGQYLSPLQPNISHSQTHPRSSSISYSLPSHSPAGSPPALSDQSFVSPPPSYLLNQSNYYLPESSPLPSNTSSIPVSPHPTAPIPPETLYSSPESAQASSDPEHQVRVISFRPRPQCWDHGCNGREFSTFSNLLRHQREKSGVVAKAECPLCGAAFTRTTARNIHVAQGKCKGGGGGGRESSSEQFFS